MSIVRGLKKINAHIEAEEAKFSGKGGDGERTRWFKLKDKESVKVIFLQELDPDSENFSTKNDLGILVTEHSNPQNYMRKASCTIDDGGCYGCDRHRENYKAKWGQRSRLYINVLVCPEGEDPYVAVMSQGNGPKSITPSLLEQATEFGTITNRWFKIKRTGSGPRDTQYLLTALGEHDKNVEDYDVYDLTKVVREIPYSEQEAFYTNGVDEAESDDETELISAGSGQSESAVW